MKTKLTLPALVAITGLFTMGGLQAQTAPPGPPAGRPPFGAGRFYNPQTVETLKGTVLSVERTTPGRGMGMGGGVHLEVKTEQGTMPVFLGPSWYMQRQNLELKPQDQVEIKGSRITIDGQEALIAQQVKVGEREVKLRDDQGHPLWAGGPRGGAPSMTGREMTPAMKARAEKRLEEHKKILEEMKAMDAALDKKVAEMNQAQGQAKIDAMANVINEMVKQREAVHKHIAAMQERMMSHMRERMEAHGAMGGPGTEDQNEQENNP